MSTMLVRVSACYRRADEIIGPAPYSRMRYSYGGGHPGFGPSFGILQDTHVLGEDCSGFASDVLHAGGILSIPAAKRAIDTEEFLRYGRPGAGKWLTVHVRNDPDPAGVHHMRLDFHGHPEFTHRYCEAPHDGAFVQWLDGEPDFTGYIARHWPGA